ncbi:unnamed protein product, partial [Polarella glacialis]
VPFSMHKRLRQKVVSQFQDDAKRNGLAVGNTILLVKGGGELSLYDTDTTWDFRQECNFQYLFGDCDAFLKYYEVDKVLYLGSDDLTGMLIQYDGVVTPLGLNLDSGLISWPAEQILGKEAAKELLDSAGKEISESLLWTKFSKEASPALRGLEPDLLPNKEISKSYLAKRFRRDLSAVFWHTIVECRAVKDVEELKILQYALAGGPVSTLKDHEFKPNGVDRSMFKNPHHRAYGVAGDMREFLSEAEFRYQSFLRGCSRTAYGCICPSGGRSAILHYGHAAEPNLELVEVGEMKLHDMGAEYHCYASDVTCTFPVTGVFNEEQKTVYNEVWATVELIEKNLMPVVRYGDMHQLAQRSLLKELQGFLFSKDYSVDEMFEAGLIGNFMPHGLGHMYGLAVHDVGGYVPTESRKTYPEIKENLRLNRELQENFTLTVEPKTNLKSRNPRTSRIGKRETRENRTTLITFFRIVSESSDSILPHTTSPI